MNVKIINHNKSNIHSIPPNCGFEKVLYFTSSMIKTSYLNQVLLDLLEWRCLNLFPQVLLEWICLYQWRQLSFHVSLIYFSVFLYQIFNCLFSRIFLSLAFKLFLLSSQFNFRWRMKNKIFFKKFNNASHSFMVLDHFLMMASALIGRPCFNALTH